MRRTVALLITGFLIISCGNDDNGGAAAIEPARPLSEVLAEDEAEIQEFLKSNYYNYSEFRNPTDSFDYRVRLMKIEEGDTVSPLSDFIEFRSIKISSSDLNIDGEEEDIEHKLYYLNAREGEGESPTEVDSVFLRYEGTRLDGTVFDSNSVSPVWQDLQGTLTQNNPGSIQGFKRGLPLFNSGGEIISNEDGTFKVEGFGSGLIILPSALAYYNGTSVGPSYSPIMFNLQVLVSNTADHDRDGIPTKDEVEIDEEGNVTLTDSNEDGLPDYLDADN